MLTNGNGGIQNNLWNNTPVAGLATQPWTVSFTYSDTNGAFGDGGSFILQTLGVSTTGGNWQANGGISPSINLVWNIVDTGHTRFSFNANGGNGATYDALGNVNMASTTADERYIACDGSSAITVRWFKARTVATSATPPTWLPPWDGQDARSIWLWRGQGSSRLGAGDSGFQLGHQRLADDMALKMASGALVASTATRRASAGSAASARDRRRRELRRPLDRRRRQHGATFSGCCSAPPRPPHELDEDRRPACKRFPARVPMRAGRRSTAALVFRAAAALPSIGTITINAGGAGGVSGPVAAASVLALTNAASTGPWPSLAANSERSISPTIPPSLSVPSATTPIAEHSSPAGLRVSPRRGGGALTSRPQSPAATA